MVRYELYCSYHYFKSKTTIKMLYLIDFIANFCVTFNKKDPVVNLSFLKEILCSMRDKVAPYPTTECEPRAPGTGPQEPYQ